MRFREACFEIAMVVPVSYQETWFRWCLRQMGGVLGKSPIPAQAARIKPQRLKLGNDVHWAQYTVDARLNGASSRPAQRINPDAFIVWVQEHLNEAHEVHGCYEAGAFGYGLHRKLASFGVYNLVGRPHK